MNEGTAKVASRIAPFVACGSVMIVWCALAVPAPVTYACGSAKAATVTRCETAYGDDNAENTTCYGSWRHHRHAAGRATELEPADAVQRAR